MGLGVIKESIGNFYLVAGEVKGYVLREARCLSIVVLLYWTWADQCQLSYSEISVHGSGWWHHCKGYIRTAQESEIPKESEPMYLCGFKRDYEVSPTIKC